MSHDDEVPDTGAASSMVVLATKKAKSNRKTTGGTGITSTSGHRGPQPPLDPVAENLIQDRK